MQLCLSDEQQQFATSLHEMLTAADTPAASRAWGQGEHQPGGKVLRELADIGVTGLLVPAEHDGIDAAYADMVVAMEVVGYHAVPGPIVESAAAVPVLLRSLPDTRPAQEWLPALAAGEVSASIALPPRVPFALDADFTELTLCGHDDAVTTLDTTGIEPTRSIDPARRLVSPPSATATTLSSGVSGQATAAAFDVGALATAAQLHGAGRWLLDTATEYAKQREQYGKPIGQNQSIKHLLADVAMRLEMSRPLLYAAAVALRDTPATSARDVSAAKVAAGNAAYLAARTALQVHGAIAYTAEHDLGLWLTKVRALLGVFGDAGFHRARVREAVAGSSREESAGAS